MVRKRNIRVGVGFAAALLAGSTIITSLLGFLREKLIISAFGFGVQLDAYKAAFGVPDFFFFLLVSGALSVTFIPVFNEKYYGTDRHGAWRLTSNLMNLMALTTFIASILIMIFASTITGWVAPGLDSETKFLAASIMRVVAINPFLFAISSVLSSMQQAFGKFLFFALSPALYNLGIIFGTVVLVPQIGIMGLAYGVVIGAILQLLLVAIGVKQTNFEYSFGIKFKSKSMRKVLKVLPARSLDQSIDYLTNIVEKRSASYLPRGSIGYYDTALMLFNMPVSLVGVAISTAAFPKMSERLEQGRPDLFSKELQKILRIIVWLSMPMAVITYVCRDYLARLPSTKIESVVVGLLSILAMLIVFKTLYHILARAFYAQKDTLTPLKVSLFTVALNISLAVYLSNPKRFGINGLAYAQLLTGSLEVVILGIILNRRFPSLISKSFIKAMLKDAFVCLLTFMFAQSIAKIPSLNPEDTFFVFVLLKLCIVASSTFMIYLLISYYMRVQEAKPVINKIKKVFNNQVRIQ
jgi:putative peptidoglycan lipid II flippase